MAVESQSECFESCGQATLAARHHRYRVCATISKVAQKSSNFSRSGILRRMAVLPSASFSLVFLVGPLHQRSMVSEADKSW
jgi:hypothetical protein